MKAESTSEKLALPAPKSVYGKPQILLLSTKLTLAGKNLPAMTEGSFTVFGARITFGRS